MSLNFSEVFNEMFSVFKAQLIQGGNEVSAELQNILTQRKNKIEQITSMRMDGTLTEPEFESELEDEKKVLETQMLELKVIEKSSIQKAINGAIDVLTSAIKKLIH